MNITIKDILEKYDTEINVKNISDKLKNTIIFGENPQDSLLRGDTLQLDEVKKPTKNVNGKYVTYTYTFGDYEMNVEYVPNNYRTMNIILTKPTPEHIPEPAYYWHWLYDGSIGSVV